MKVVSLALVLLLSLQSFAHAHGRHDRRGNHRHDHGRHHDDTLFNVLDLSSNLSILSSFTFDDNKEAVQVVNDAQDFMQSGKMSLLLEQVVTGIQANNADLSVEDSVDLILNSVN